MPCGSPHARAAIGSTLLRSPSPNNPIAYIANDAWRRSSPNTWPTSPKYSSSRSIPLPSRTCSISTLDHAWRERTNSWRPKLITDRNDPTFQIGVSPAVVLSCWKSRSVGTDAVPRFVPSTSSSPVHPAATNRAPWEKSQGVSPFSARPPPASSRYPHSMCRQCAAGMHAPRAF